ncbi:hypothetical protein [Bradyrhizobium sp. S3.2.12]|uniref:hypothetical protein n=1 Tax=Bradyrhizobium sp. S3.2.12 TaxID=3156387 RepID=UPI0033918B7D
MKHAAERPYADSETAARKLVELAANVQAVQDGGRIYIERINAPLMIELKGQRQRVRRRAQIRDRAAGLSKHESGTYVKLMSPGEDLLTTPTA